MSDLRESCNDESKRDIPSFIEPMPPLISNPFMRPRPQKGTNLLDLFEDEEEEPDLVEVYLRLKPHHAINNLYEVKSDRCLITSVDTATAGHGRRTQHNVSKMYTFSHIFGPEASQKEIFENVVKDNLKRLPDGHSFTLLTYGASGSGKTYTLMGTVASPGLVPRSLEYVFRVVDAAQRPFFKPSDGGAVELNIAHQEYELQWVNTLRRVSAPLRQKYRRMSVALSNDLTGSSLDLNIRKSHYVWVSFVEIYNERIYDLLSPSDKRNALRIREDANGNVYVKDASQAFVRSASEAYDVLAAGKHQLQVAATGVHAQSSRSHCIFTITMLTETESGVRTSCVRLCDLAGCERARHTRNTGARMAESRAINSSLHVLERCLHTLHRRQRNRVPAATCVPYRESKLTRLLGAGLTGAHGESVAMVVTLNPAPEYAHETKHVLQLAAVARDIQLNNTIATQDFTRTESSIAESTINSNDDLIMRLRTDNERLQFELVRAQAHIGELTATMEQKQRDTANTMRDLVEEAKDMTKEYYEALIKRLKDEMADMEREYEDLLSEAADAKAAKDSPSHQKEVEQLMMKVAILEDQLNAERLARARADEEVNYLRECIEERDDEAYEDNAPAKDEDVISVSESDNENGEEKDDILNESLEPIFKKQNNNKSINESRLINCCVDSPRYDSTAPSFHEITEIDSTDKTDFFKSDLFSGTTTNDSVCVSETVESNKKQSLNMLNEQEVTGNRLVKSGKELNTKNDLEKHVNVEKVKSFSRDTYFISDKNVDPLLKVSEQHNIPMVNSVQSKNEVNTAVKVSGKFVNKIINSTKTSHGSNTSLIQFEQLEMAAKKCNENTNGISVDFKNIKICNEKRTFFDNKALGIVTEDINTTPKVNTVKKTIGKPSDEDRSPSIVKDYVQNDFKTSTIKMLLGESLTRQPDIISSVHKNSMLQKKHDSIDIFEELHSPHLKVTESPYIVEIPRPSIEELVLDQRSASKASDKQVNNLESEAIFDNVIVSTDQLNKNYLPREAKVTEKTQEFQILSNQNNTIEEFENIYINITVPRATDFEVLVSQDTNSNHNKEIQPTAEENKYNLRRKTHTKDLCFADEVEKGEIEDHAKCASVRNIRTKKNLRLRRRKNQNDYDDISDQENSKLRDIDNLQKEFSDVTMDVPAPSKEIKDIPSPKKAFRGEENVPPILDIQSCPSKSVTRSRRKLFTPKVEPLDEGEPPGGSDDRVYVPRPSYHRTRARRKL